MPISTKNFLLVALTCCFLAIPEIGRSEPFWQFQNPHPVAGTISSVDFVDEDIGWLITDAGFLVRTTDGGFNWAEVDFPVQSRGPWKLDFYNENDGWIIGGPDSESPWLSVLYVTDDGGDNWEAFSLGSEREPAELVCLQAGGAGNGWIGGSIVTGDARVPAVFRLNDEGNWRTTTLPNDIRSSVRDIHMIQDIGFAIGEDGYIAGTQDGGIEWEIVDSGIEEDLNTVYFINPLVGWVGGGSFGNGVIYRTTTNGASWDQTEDALDNIVLDIHAASANLIYAATQFGDDNAQLFISNNGVDWEVDYSDDKYDLTDVFASNAINVLVGSEGFISVKTADGWEDRTRRSLFGNINDIYFINNQRGYLVGANGQLFTTTNNRNWRSLDAGIEGDLLSVSFDNRTDGWIGGEGSVELFTTDGGSDWQDIDISEYNVRDLQFTNTVDYAMTNRSICTSTDGGYEWEETVFYPELSTEIRSFSVASSARAFFATGDSLVRTTDSGENWTKIFDNVNGVHFIDNRNGFFFQIIQGADTRIFSSDDGGDHWVRLSTIQGFTALGIFFIDENLGYIWSDEGKILRTYNGGSNWTETAFRFRGRINSLYGLDEDNLWACGEFGMVGYYGEDIQLAVSDDSYRKTMPVKTVIETVYPNPTNGMVSIVLSPIQSQSLDFILRDLQGRTILRNNFRNNKHPNRISLDLSGYPSGGYLINVVGDNQTSSMPFQLVK